MHLPLPEFLQFWSTLLEAAKKDPLWGTIALTNGFITTLMGLVIAQYLFLRKLIISNSEELSKTRKALKFHNDPSCAWTDKEDFFNDICDKIDALGDKARVHLHIYRGYDQGTAEPNITLQKAIIRALRSDKITEFHRVVVVTSKAFIPTAVEWMIPFSTEEALRKKCYFYVAFRRKFNLGSYVALGRDKCFIAMPKLERNPRVPPSTTQNGIFAEDENIADIIRHYIDNQAGEASDHTSIHGIDCPLEGHRWEWMQRRVLEKRITDAFDHFTHRSTMGTQTPVPPR